MSSDPSSSSTTPPLLKNKTPPTTSSVSVSPFTTTSNNKKPSATSTLTKVPTNIPVQKSDQKTKMPLPKPRTKVVAPSTENVLVNKASTIVFSVESGKVKLTGEHLTKGPLFWVNGCSRDYAGSENYPQFHGFNRCDSEIWSGYEAYEKPLDGLTIDEQFESLIDAWLNGCQYDYCEASKTFSRNYTPRGDDRTKTDSFRILVLKNANLTASDVGLFISSYANVVSYVPQRPKKQITSNYTNNKN